MTVWRRGVGVTVGKRGGGCDCGEERGGCDWCDCLWRRDVRCLKQQTKALIFQKC